MRNKSELKNEIIEILEQKKEIVDILNSLDLNPSYELVFFIQLNLILNELKKRSCSMKAKPSAWKQAALDAGFRSEEEWKFWLWLKELQENEIVFMPKYVDKDPDFTWELSPKQTYNLGFKKPKSLLIKHLYNCDFHFTGITKHLFFIPKNVHKNTKDPGYCEFLADVKGNYESRGKHAEFKINQKWLYDKYNIYVNKVIPDELFVKTFAPTALMMQPIRNKPSKYATYKTCREWLETVKR